MRKRALVRLSQTWDLVFPMSEPESVRCSLRDSLSLSISYFGEVELQQSCAVHFLVFVVNKVSAKARGLLCVGDVQYLSAL